MSTIHKITRLLEGIYQVMKSVVSFFIPGFNLVKYKVMVLLVLMNILAQFQTVMAQIIGFFTDKSRYMFIWSKAELMTSPNAC